MTDSEMATPKKEVDRKPVVNPSGDTLLTIEGGGIVITLDGALVEPTESVTNSALVTLNLTISIYKAEDTHLIAEKSLSYVTFESAESIDGLYVLDPVECYEVEFPIEPAQLGNVAVRVRLSTSDDQTVLLSAYLVFDEDGRVRCGEHGRGLPTAVVGWRPARPQATLAGPSLAPDRRGTPLKQAEARVKGSWLAAEKKEKCVTARRKLVSPSWGKSTFRPSGDRAEPHFVPVTTRPEPNLATTSPAVPTSLRPQATPTSPRPRCLAGPRPGRAPSWPCPATPTSASRPSRSRPRGRSSMPCPLSTMGNGL